MRDAKATLLLDHHLKQLKLPTMLREYASVAARCTQDRSDYPTYLLRLAERELLDRQQRATERRIKAAKFPALKTLDTFDFAAQPSINEPLVRQLMAGEYLDRRETSCWWATRGPARPIWPRRSGSRPARRGGGSGSSPSRDW